MILKNLLPPSSEQEGQDGCSKLIPHISILQTPRYLTGWYHITLQTKVHLLNNTGMVHYHWDIPECGDRETLSWTQQSKSFTRNKHKWTTLIIGRKFRDFCSNRICERISVFHHLTWTMGQDTPEQDKAVQILDSETLQMSYLLSQSRILVPLLQQALFEMDIYKWPSVRYAELHTWMVDRVPHRTQAAYRWNLHHIIDSLCHKFQTNTKKNIPTNKRKPASKWSQAQRDK